MTSCADLHHDIGVLALGLSNGTFRLYQVCPGMSGTKVMLLAQLAL